MQIIVSPQPSADAAESIARRLGDAVRRRGSATLALSGGSTAPPMIEQLVQLDIDWSVLTVWQVDERVAPDGHDARNEIQLRALPCRVVAMPVTDADLRTAARRYAASLPDRFDLVHLGLGSDGHTASWPPGDVKTSRSDRPVELVDEFNGWPRMTLTRRVVIGARSRVVLTTGASKRPMLERWLLADTSLPISEVRRSRTTVFVDEPAAPDAQVHPAD